MSVPPTIETKRLILKEVSLVDVSAYERHFVDYEVIGHLTSAVPWPYPKNGVKEFLETFIPKIRGYVKTCQ
ncbi:MAG: hypothetical protein IPK68_09260 [Bdellovibrionales bacterium]|jgi:[ribosomal protein S5]-alanine N-acetyltransferase|nr:hypothetical protein [Bdellovibrionales bacterium]